MSSHDRDRDRNYGSTNSASSTTSTQPATKPTRLLPWMRGAATNQVSDQHVSSSAPTSQSTTSQPVTKSPPSNTGWESILDTDCDQKSKPTLKSKESNPTTTTDSTPQSKSIDANCTNPLQDQSSPNDDSPGDQIAKGHNPFANRGGATYQQQQSKPHNQPSSNNNTNTSDAKSTKTTHSTKDQKETGQRQDQKQQHRYIQLRISDRLGTKVQVRVNSGQTIFQLKQIVGPKIGRRPEKITLSRGGVVLKDTVTVFDAGLSDNVQVELL